MKKLGRILGGAIALFGGMIPVALAAQRPVYVLSGQTDAVATVVAGRVVSTTPTGGYPVAVARVQQTLLVLNHDAGNIAMFTIAGTHLTPKNTWVATDTHPVAMAAQGRHVYVVANGRIDAYHANARGVIDAPAQSLPGPCDPSAVGIIGQVLVVLSVKDHTLTQYGIRPQGLTPEGRVSVGRFPSALATAGDALYVADDTPAGRVFGYRLEDGRLRQVSRTVVGAYPTAVAANGDHLYVLEPATDTVSVYRQHEGQMGSSSVHMTTDGLILAATDRGALVATQDGRLMAFRGGAAKEVCAHAAVMPTAIVE